MSSLGPRRSAVKRNTGKSGSGVETVLVANLYEALRQANRYLALGLFSSLLLFALSLDPGAFSSGNISLPGVLPPLPVRYAQIALSLVYWVMPFLIDFSLARADRIAGALKLINPPLLEAAVTFPSIATTRVHGARWITTLLPPILIGITGWLKGIFSFTGLGLFLFGLAVGPYLIVFGLRLRKSFGDLAPDRQGD